MAAFKFLYGFSCPDFNLIEIKRTDLGPNAPLSDVYKWLIVDEKKSEVIELIFRSMSNNDLFEFRLFQQAELQFNSEVANFKWEGRDYTLRSHIFKPTGPVSKLIDMHLPNVT